VIQGYDFTQYIIKTQTGTAVPHISGTQIKDFAFLMPPLSEQEEIAKTLGVLDRKLTTSENRTRR
jgi:type I restriction enzyme S subunit